MKSRPKCAPRIIKRLKKQNKKDSKDSKTNDEQAYKFHRKYVHPAILRLKNEKSTYFKNILKLMFWIKIVDIF